MIRSPKQAPRKSRAFLGKDPIGPLLARLSLPAMVGMLVMASYQVVDAIFIGRGVGTAALGSITIIFPITMLMGAIAAMIGVGGASVISRALGAEDHNRAERAFGNVLFLILCAGLLIPLGVGAFLHRIVYFFGARDPILPYAVIYLETLLLGVPLHIFSMSSNNVVRAEGEAKTAMMTMIVGALVNVVLDWHFIFNLSLGIRGAALATIIGQGCSALWLFSWFFLRRRSCLEFSWKNLIPRKTMIGEILAIGFSDFLRMGAVGMVGAISNTTIFLHGGHLFVAAFGVIQRLFALIFMPIFGISQGAQPIVGFNFGAGQYHRSRAAIRLASFVATAFSCTAFVLLQSFPAQIMEFFSPDPLLVETGIRVMRLISLGIWLVGFQVIGATVFQALGKALPAMILSLSRQVLFVLPLMVILPRFFGITGALSTFPLADGLSALVTLWLVRKELQILDDLSPVLPEESPV
ncbi:MAG TPA: MATE family efflux transporter [Synergistaceae bacterium]|nr:MATE family efflux transporter [Synergistaceae bacterium]